MAHAHTRRPTARDNHAPTHSTQGKKSRPQLFLAAGVLTLPLPLLRAAPARAGGLLAAAVDHLERETADDKDPLAGLSPRELQLVLLYFAQEGRDAYCALEVFDWLRRADRVDGETMELMTAIACGWIEYLVGAGGDISDVSALLGEMDCVGLRPGFSLVEKAVVLYWDRSERTRTVEFVRDVLRRGAVGTGEDYDGERGGPVGYLAWKMMLASPLLF